MEVFSQVVTLAVYSYLLSTVMGSQFVESADGSAAAGGFDLYIPVFTFLQFFFYMGWLKVSFGLSCCIVAVTSGPSENFFHKEVIGEHRCTFSCVS